MRISQVVYYEIIFFSQKLNTFGGMFDFCGQVTTYGANGDLLNLLFIVEGQDIPDNFSFRWHTNNWFGEMYLPATLMDAVTSSLQSGKKFMINIDDSGAAPAQNMLFV